MKTNPHAPAHPHLVSNNYYDGMTKREYMATHILAGLAAAPPQPNAYNLSADEKAQKAVLMTDQLIEALNRGPRG